MELTPWYGYTDAAIVSEIGFRLRMQRLLINVTQQTLAQRAGLNRTTVRDIEQGKPVNVLSLIAVFRELGLLENLDASIPSLEKHPVIASEQKHRQRVRPAKKG